MKKKRRGSGRIMAGVLLCAGIALFTGCGAGKSAGQSVEDLEIQQQDRDTEPAAVNGQNENTKADESGKTVLPERVQELRQAQTRHYYGGILSQVMAAWRLPDMELGVGTSADDTLDAAKMAENCFAVADVDQDGREELLVRWTTTTTAGELEAVYDYDPVNGKLTREFYAYPALTYYDNGVIKAEWSHNQTPPAQFWPCTFYQYEQESGVYAEIGSLRAWDDGIEGWDFPADLDEDGDGTVYEIRRAGEEYSDYEGFKFNQADVDEWLDGFMGSAKEIPLVYHPMKHESFADFTPAYLKMLAEEAGRERTDTAADLGLLVLYEDHFLDAAQTLLTEKYGVAMEQPDPDFEEWTVGLKDGKERFSFAALNAGHIGYTGEKLEDVTIFGIYPGIAVDSAWEKLKAYGFYDSSYGEVENCLITGEGFGNISIWFSSANNVVTDITVGPYCAFAG